ncbi:MAG: hypothetical protein ACXVBO_18520, partial [Isosphaeraceae bacterium]
RCPRAHQPFPEILEDRQLLTASLQPILNLTVPAQLGYQLALDGSGNITPARKFRMLLHINPTRQRGKRTGSLARASGWYMTFFAAGVIEEAAGS